MRYFNSPSYNSTMEGLDVTTSATPPAEKPMPPCRHAAATFPFVLIPTHSSYKQLSAGPPFPDSPAAAFITPQMLDRMEVVGTGEQVCEQLKRIEDAGFKTFGTVTYTIKDKREMMQRIGEVVMPHFKTN